MRLKTIILFVLLAGFSSAQTIRSGSLTDYIDSVLLTMPSTEFSDEYVEPDVTQLSQWGSLVQNILNANYTSADSLANILSYALYAYTDTTDSQDKLYYLLAKTPGGANYWGSFIFDQSPQRQKVVVQSPHPLFDTHTGKQGIVIFKTLGARAFCISGTHRCNSSDSTSCAGTTSVCTGLNNVKFRKSDQPHNVSATFQRTLEILNSSLSNLVIIQNHGFAKDNGDPDLIMSNGVAKSPTVDYLASVMDYLLQVDSSFTFKILHVDTTWNTLTGTTNVQGRLINGSTNPCTKSASANTGRFLHIEQAYTKLRDSQTNRARLADALAYAFPLDPLPVELVSFTAVAAGCEVILRWQTATETNNTGFSVQRKSTTPNGSSTDWVTITFIAGSGNSNAPKNYSFTDRYLNSGMYSYRLVQTDADGSTTLSKEQTIVFSDNLPAQFSISVYPNPFNITCKADIINPVPGIVAIALFDIIGRKVRTVFNGYAEAGRFSLAIDGKELSSGIYTLQVSGVTGGVTRKLLLMK